MLGSFHIFHFGCSLPLSHSDSFRQLPIFPVPLTPLNVSSLIFLPCVPGESPLSISLNPDLRLPCLHHHPGPDLLLSIIAPCTLQPLPSSLRDPTQSMHSAPCQGKDGEWSVMRLAQYGERRGRCSLQSDPCVFTLLQTLLFPFLA